MTDTIQFLHYNHINQTVDDLDTAAKHFTDVLGGQFLWETPPNPFTRACLVNLGGAVIELVQKRKPMGSQPENGDYSFWYCPGTTGFLMDWDRVGPSFVGCEFLVGDLEKALRSAREQGLRVFDQTEYNFFLTYADQCHGIAYEVTDVNWYQRPSPDYFVEEMHNASHWSDAHPLGILGYRFSVAVNSLTGVADFFARLCSSTVQTKENRPDIAGQVLTLTMADIDVDFIAPTGNGPIRSYVDRYGEKIRALIFRVRDVNAVRSYFADRNVALVAGDVPGSVAILPDQNLGVLYQFEPERRSAAARA